MICASQAPEEQMYKCKLGTSLRDENFLERDDVPFVVCLGKNTFGDDVRKYSWISVLVEKECGWFCLWTDQCGWLKLSLVSFPDPDQQFKFAVDQINVVDFAFDQIKPEDMRAFFVPPGKGVYFHPGEKNIPELRIRVGLVSDV